MESAMIKYLILALLLASPVRAQYAHRGVPSSAADPAINITTAGASNCPGSGCAEVDASGGGTAFVKVTVTSGTYGFKCSNDAWATTIAVNAYAYDTSTGIVTMTPVTTTSATGSWIIPLTACRRFGVYSTVAGVATARVDVDPMPAALAVNPATTTPTAPTGGNLTSNTATQVYAGSAGVCQVAVSDLSTSLPMTCGQTNAVSATVGLYVPPLGTYTTTQGYGGAVWCYPTNSGTPAYSVQVTVCR